MPKKDLEAYREWFYRAVTRERIAELTRAVKTTPGYESWEADLTPASLDVLGRWFERQVEIRKKTHEELEETRSKLTFPIDVPEEELTNRSFSLQWTSGCTSVRWC